MSIAEYETLKTTKYLHFSYWCQLIPAGGWYQILILFFAQCSILLIPSIPMLKPHRSSAHAYAGSTWSVTYTVAKKIKHVKHCKLETIS